MNAILELLASIGRMVGGWCGARSIKLAFPSMILGKRFTCFFLGSATSGSESEAITLFTYAYKDFLQGILFFKKQN
jgi:hypothetical protein